MSNADLLPDDVWNQLDHNVTALHRRDRWALAGLVAVIALVVALVGVARDSGVLRPRLSAAVFTSERTGTAVLARFSVRNNDWSVETIVGVGAPSAGTRVVSVEPSRLSIPSGQTRVLTVHLQITDCTQFDGLDDAHLQLRLSRWWGSAPATITFPIAGGTSGC